MLERLYRRSVPPEQVATTELMNYMCECSRSINRQVGVLLDRRGQMVRVVVGDAHKILLPELPRVRSGLGRLSGVRLLHTHLSAHGLDRDDLTDLTRLALDLVGAVTMDGEGSPRQIHVAHLVPHDPARIAREPWLILPPRPFHALDLTFDHFIQELETEFRHKARALRADQGKDQAIVVHVDDGGEVNGRGPETAVSEMRELARTAGIAIVDVILQRRRRSDPRYVIGRGKLEELVLQAMHRQVELVIFNRDLQPAQVRAISDLTDLKVIDRSQLILDIFAQRATTRAGKRRVELAQLKYALPRLVAKNTAMSRLTGGIGGRGPGETKLELNRRLAKKRIRQLESEIERLRDERAGRRKLRDRRRLPVIGIVGYTNAGKSTLLNVLTRSDVPAEDKLFATLDPTSRRLRFPEEREVILSDTVGFIHDLPPELISAFLATLEELQTADLLIHVVDASNPHAENHIHAVNEILSSLGLSQVPCVVAFNKTDRVRSLQELEALCRAHDGLPICALKRDTLRPLLARAAKLLWPNGQDDVEPRRAPKGETELINSDGGIRTERIN